MTTRSLFGDDLPPGVSVHDLPGNERAPVRTAESCCAVRGCAGIILADTEDWPAPLCPAHTPDWLPELGADPLGQLLRLIPSELRSVTVEHARMGGMVRVTCVRTHGAPLTTLHRDLDVAVRLAVEELAPRPTEAPCPIG
jgi:hypothetical protein